MGDQVVDGLVVLLQYKFLISLCLRDNRLLYRGSSKDILLISGTHSNDGVSYSWIPKAQLRQHAAPEFWRKEPCYSLGGLGAEEFCILAFLLCARTENQTAVRTDTGSWSVVCWSRLAALALRRTAFVVVAITRSLWAPTSTARGFLFVTFNTSNPTDIVSYLAWIVNDYLTCKWYTLSLLWA